MYRCLPCYCTRWSARKFRCIQC